jgi:hypothetical protein
LASLSPDAQLRLRGDYISVLHAVDNGVVAGRSTLAIASWNNWSAFCRDLHIDPHLRQVTDPVTLLQIFGHRYRSGTLRPGGRPVRSRTVEDSIRCIAQTFTRVGAADPRLDSSNNIDFRLQRQLRSYSKEDPPPTRVKPIPVSVITQTLALAYATSSPGSHAIGDMTSLGFFFLLRPGEYTISPAESTPFRIQDVSLRLAGQRLNLSTAPDTDILNADFVTLEFDTQKSGVRGEVVGLGRSGNPHLCPVLATARRIVHLRANNAPPSQPLATYFEAGVWHNVLSRDITAALRATLAFVGPHTVGLSLTDITARSLRASGAMALLVSKVDTDLIRLLGRWRSDEMLRYLHLQAQPIMQRFARLMVTHGDYHLLPNSNVLPPPG